MTPLDVAGSRAGHESYPVPPASRDSRELRAGERALASRKTRSRILFL